MDISQGIEKRRAVKSFDASHQMPDAEFDRLMELVRMGPTAFNIQNWRFVRLTQPSLRQAVRAAAWDQPQVTDASVVLVLCADLKAWAREPRRYWAHAPEPVQEFMLPAIRAYYEGKPQVERDEAMRSCGIAAMTLMLAAQELGYESCPMDGFDFEAVGKLINLPADHVVAIMVAIGKGTKAPWPRGGKVPLSEILIEDKFASPSQNKQYS